jgi:hypothetical protein
MAQPIVNAYAGGANIINIQDGSVFPAQSSHFAIYNSQYTNVFAGEVVGDAIIVDASTSGGVLEDYSISDDEVGDTFVVPLNFVRYYVAADDDGIPTLYREQPLNATDTISVPVLSGVENMQITYQELDNGWGEGNFVSAADIRSMNQVVAIKIGILVRSETESGAVEGISDGDYNLAGTTVTIDKDDRYLRRAFNVIVNLRRRVS